MKIMLDKGAKMPTRAHEWDAGLDLYAMHDGIVDYSKTFDKCELPELELVDSLDETDRGDNGFGSTGR